MIPVHKDTPCITVLDAISEAESEAERLVDSFLRSRGWKLTCDVPGALWLWEKQLEDGRIVLVGQSSAMHMQQTLEPWDDEDGDEY